jgi:hypothetical protein
MSDYDELPNSGDVIPAITPTATQAIDYSTVEKGPDGVVFVMGRERVVVPPLSFWSLARCVNEFQEASNSDTMMERVGAVLRVVASSLALTDWRKEERARLLSETESIPWIFDQLCKMLRGNEWMELSKAYGVLLVESGLLDGESLYSPSGSRPTEGGGGPPRGEGGPALLNQSSAGKAETSAKQLMPNGLATIQ